MQQFKKTWKAKGALLNKCTVISGTIWIIKTALNIIIQAILAAFFNAGGPFYVALCESGLELGPVGASYDSLSYVTWAIQIALDQLYIKYRDAGKKVLAGMSNHGLDWSLCLSVSIQSHFVLTHCISSFLSYSGPKIGSMCSLILRT
jgi:hypothetical protein